MANDKEQSPLARRSTKFSILERGQIAKHVLHLQQDRSASSCTPHEFYAPEFEISCRFESLDQALIEMEKAELAILNLVTPGRLMLVTSRGWSILPQDSDYFAVCAISCVWL